MKFKEPFQVVEDFITKKHDEQVDRWNAGMNNNLEEWDRFIDYFTDIERVQELRKDNAELRMYNHKLEQENKRLKEALNNGTN